MIIFFRIFLVSVFYHIYLFAHCQIPCGIYSDAMQIIQIQEDLSTIEKAMEMINSLSEKSDPQTLNQIVRWINKKEEHAQNIQNITSEYFLTQRIKTNTDNYNKKIIILHKLLLSAMKCKQTVEIKNVINAKTLLESFSQLYFDEHGLRHLKNLEENNK